MMKYKPKQAGFSLVTTIFILVILVLLGTYMISLVQTQNQAASLQILSSRAGLISYSGLEWGVKKAIADDACTNVQGEAFTLDGFQVVLACEGPYTIDENSETYSVFKITAAAQWGSYGDADFVSRKTEATVRGGS